MTVQANPGRGFINVSWDTGQASNVSRSDGRSFGAQNSPMNDFCPTCKRAFTYTVRLGNGGINGPSNQTILYACCFTNQSTHLTVIGQDMPENPFGSFVFLVPLENVVLQYFHAPGDIVGGTWKRAQSLQLNANQVVLDTSLSLIQSSSKKLEAIVQVGEQTVPFGQQEGLLLGYELVPGGQWSAPIHLQAANGPLNHVTGSQALIQSFRNSQDQFELLVPNTNVISHYTHTAESLLAGPWTLAAQLSLPALGSIFEQRTAISLLQSTSGELIALATSLSVLFGYVLAEGSNWSGPFEIQSEQGPIVGITGGLAFIQRDENTFDLVVVIGGELIHYTLENQPFQTGAWKRVARLNPPEDNRLIQTVSMTLTQNAEGNLELVTRASPLLGVESDFMVGYVFNQVTNTWQHGFDLVDENGQKIIATDGLKPSPIDPDSSTRQSEL